MASIGKLSNSLIQASQETQVALASLNFDFSLIKYEAPAEYLALGQCLSRGRKEVAEDGRIHITARKLGALFESEIPEVPNLLEAYGRRVSEVASTPNANPQGSKAHGAFADHVGADGTTIWASATSGKGVVTMHLLACMLARIWKGSEAISIWSELVQHRKSLLEGKVSTSGSFHTSELAASRIEITRDQLADWDASARAWVASADKVKAVQQVQLRLIMENISLPVSRKTELYPAVIDAWSKAMVALDNLILGQPQRIHSGDVLLGISAWHLYPDMAVLQEQTHRVCQNDELIHPGGVITIGLENRPDQAGDGIYWSLPLAHLRYYGVPMQATRYSGLRESQVSFDQFRYVILGSILSTWGPLEPDLKSAIHLIIRLADVVLTGKYVTKQQSASLKWLQSLAACCKEMKTASDVERKRQFSLIGFGRRKTADFLSPANEHPRPAFGLTNMELILRLFPSEKDLKIKFLRTWAHMFLDRKIHADAIIRYRKHNYEPFTFTKVFENPVVGRKRPFQEEFSSSTFQHWRHDWELKLDALNPDKVCAMVRKRGMVEFSAPSYGASSGLNCDDEPSEDVSNTMFPPGPYEKATEFTFLCGNLGSAAIFQPVGATPHTELSAYPNHMKVANLLQCLERGYISALSLVEILLRSSHKSPHASYYNSLESLTVVETLYQQLPGSSVDLQVTSRSVPECMWTKLIAEGGLSTPALHPIQAFSCIAMFETGFVDVGAKDLDGVVALSYKDSLFVARYLLEDLGNEDERFPVTRVAGNVGKPGFSLIITPANPKVRQVDYNSWQVVEHTPWDGHATDHFASTSLHLCLTGYELPLDLGPRGSRDADAAFIEAAISVHEGGKWIADLDVVAAYKAECERRQQKIDCSHELENRGPMSHEWGLLSVQNWTEFLDPPTRGCVFLAHGNSLARFAAATLCIQKGYKFQIIGKDECWPCVLSPSSLSKEGNAAVVDPAYDTRSASGNSYGSPVQSMGSDADMSDDDVVQDDDVTRDDEEFGSLFGIQRIQCMPPELSVVDPLENLGMVVFIW